MLHDAAIGGITPWLGLNMKTKAKRPVLRDAIFYVLLIAGTIAATAWMQIALDLRKS